MFFKDNLIWDIGIFVAAIVVGQLIAYRIMKTKEEVPAANFLAAILIAIALIAFGLFTYLAPHSFVFLDPINKGYGL